MKKFYIFIFFISLLITISCNQNIEIKSKFLDNKTEPEIETTEEKSIEEGLEKALKTELNSLDDTTVLMNKYEIVFDGAKTYQIWLYTEKRPSNEEINDFGTKIAKKLEATNPNYYYNFLIFPSDSQKKPNDTLKYDHYIDLSWRNGKFQFPLNKNPDWSRKYNIETQKEGDTVYRISDYPCILDSDCKEFCYDLGSQGVISYRFSCKQNVCVCSASRFAD
jgi:hypothetical protein